MMTIILFDNCRIENRCSIQILMLAISDRIELYPKEQGRIMSEQAVMEIAIRKVKTGKDAEFRQARSAFIARLKAQQGIEKDWEFQSFFTMPEPDDTDVFVGMTRYESVEAASGIAEQLMSSEEAQSFFGTFDMRAFVMVKPVDGGDFKLEEHIQTPDQVLEVAVRSSNAGEDAFWSARDAFFAAVAEQPGYIMDREFVDLQTQVRVVLIAWESKHAFLAALNALQTRLEMKAFFSILDVQAYQAVQPVAN
jgi:heme-degrading monooxygenase HmoA